MSVDISHGGCCGDPCCSYVHTHTVTCICVGGYRHSKGKVFVVCVHSRCWEYLIKSFKRFCIFVDMGDYMTLAAAHVLVGFEIDVFGMLNSGNTNDDSAAACLISGMLCYLITAFLMVLIKAGGQGGNKPVQICACLLIFVAALLTAVGSGLWGAARNWSNDRNTRLPYAMTCDAVAAFMALLAGIFLALDLMGKSKTGPK